MADGITIYIFLIMVLLCSILLNLSVISMLIYTYILPKKEKRLVFPPQPASWTEKDGVIKLYEDNNGSK